MSSVAKKTAAQRARRVEHTRAWRERRERGAAVYPVEIDGRVFDLMVRFGGLQPHQEGDKQAIADAFSRLLDLALAALRREVDARH
jgi:hypothetical protein